MAAAGDVAGLGEHRIPPWWVKPVCDVKDDNDRDRN